MVLFASVTLMLAACTGSATVTTTSRPLRLGNVVARTVLYGLRQATALPVPTCLPDQITASNGPRIGGGLGESSLLVALTNSGRAPCILDGYPRVQLVTSTGTVLDLRQVAQSQFLTSAGPRPVRLGVGAAAYVLVAKYACVLGDLRRASWVRLILPGAKTGRVLTVSLVNAIGDLVLCKGGPKDMGNEIAVTPVEPTVAATLPGSRLPGRTTTTTVPGRSSTTTQRGTASACKGRRPTALQPGSVVPVTELRGVDLLTRTTGVGVTFPLLACSTNGIASYPSWLVASDNSGQTWRVAGSQLPTWLGPNASTPVFASPQKGWLNAGGQLAFTDNGGRTWEKVKLGRPSHGFSGIQLAASGHYVAAMVPNPFSGVLQVWRLPPTGTQRSPEPALREPARMQDQSLEVVPGIGQLLVYQVYFPGRSETLTARIFLIGAHQGSWQAIPLPRCRLGELEVVVPAGGQTLAAVCGQGLGMMHESKAFYLSANEGRTWQERSQLNAWKGSQSSMPFQDLLGLAASSANTYYMATVNELGVTHDGGRTWSQIYWGAAGLGGMTTSFVDPQHGWILLAQAALLRTTDGTHWTAYPVPGVLSLCETSQLRLAVARVLGRAMSQDGLFFSYTNLSNVSCTLDGYPMLQVYGQRKRAMLTRLAHSGGIFFSDPGPRLVTLVLKASAYFGFSWPSTNQPNVSQTGCIGKATVSSTPPGNSTSSTISLDFAKGPLTPICRGVGGVTAVAPRDAFVPSTP